MPVYAVKNRETIKYDNCPYCNKPFSNSNSQLVDVLHFQMCDFNKQKESKQKKQVKRLQGQKITHGYKTK